VVSGESTPDTYILDKESLEVRERKLGPKSKYVTCKKVGVAEEELPLEKSGKFCLTDEQAKEIGKLSKILEDHFGVPQDIEWAIDEVYHSRKMLSFCRLVLKL